MEEKEQKQVSLELMEIADAAYLSTIDSNGFPQTRVMGNLRNTEQYPDLKEVFSGHDEDFLIYLTTSASSDKMTQIKANPKVSVYFCKPDDLRSLMLAGTIEIVNDTELEKQIWQDGWENYYPGGADDPGYTILRLSPIFAKGWYKSAPFEIKLK